MEFKDFSSEFELATLRSSGPGGQHVNKTETKVEIRFNIVLSKLLTDTEKTLLLHKLAKKLAEDQIIIVTCQQTRSQLKNKTIALDKLNHILNQHLAPVIPRVPTRPTKESKEKRLTEKKQSGSIKSMRGNLKNKEL
jgi:ribosome-associated protein